MVAGEEPKIRVIGTPNPNAAKFELERAIFHDRGRSYFDPPPPGDDPLAERLYQVKGVCALLMVDNFVTVTKEENVGWPEIIDEIQAAILEELARAS